MSFLGKQKKLLSLIEKAKQQERFTHAYLACGSLLSSKKSFELLLSDDGKNIFDLASLTKALVTTPLLFCEEEKRSGVFAMSVEELLKSKAFFLPQQIKDLNILDLLSHTSGLPAWRSLWISCGQVDQNSFYVKNPEEHFLDRLKTLFVSKNNTS